ncbi:MAG TPA: protein translocase subunit SecF [Ktedonobacteraceae bacterium]|nr:protein translocase subunit SecF [Ktedonobacteraceae bacterium]
MFNLVGKRYLFLIISLIIIVPGTLSLIVKGLNVGIDFRGGATVELRPSTSLTATAMKNLLQPLKLENLQVTTGASASLPGPNVIWVRLNTQIDSTVTKYIIDTLQKQYGSQLTVQVDDLVIGGNKISTLNITNFKQGAAPPTSGDVVTALGKIPNTSDLSKLTVTPTVIPTATSAAKATGTPAATATAQPKTTPTAKVGKGTPTPVASPTPTPVPTKPVQVVEAKAGDTTQTISLLTSTEVNTDKIVAIKSTIFNGSGTYVYVISNASVSASVASETTLRAFLAVLAASVCILLYIWFSFRKVAKPWRYGACAIIALLHDVLVVLGIFSILGWLLAIQVDTLFITAILTVVGFSVHDTIVVFDRIRENMQRRTSETFDQVVNASLVQTLARSLNTSLTVIFTLTALTLFGGLSIRTFTLALLIGIISGTYSSIFNASMLLVIWEKGELGFNRLRRGGSSGRSSGGRDARELVGSRR